MENNSDVNICSLSDSYKFGHWDMLPPNTNKVYSYFESRTGAKYNNTVFFGLQYILKKYFVGRIVTQEKINEASIEMMSHLGLDIFNEKMWDHILQFWDGKLPVTIKAVPEGMPVPVNNVLMTVESNDSECASLTNFLETILTHVWAASTVATKSREIKKIIKCYMELTSDNMGLLNFMLHDFGFRGVTSVESAGFTGAGHLVNFYGTDTFAACKNIMKYYNSSMPAYSVLATEHSIMTSMGRKGEMEVFERLLDKYPNGILSVVIDSYDYKNFIFQAGTRFREKILTRDGKVVFRPDSGDPVNVSLWVLDNTEKYFGSTINGMGYKVLNPKVGVLWGDGIKTEGIITIYEAMKQAGYSAENMVVGMGGGLLQDMTRDTQRFAFKSSYQERDGIGYDIFKDPIDGSKKSKKGRLVLIRTEDGARTINEKEYNEEQHGSDLLETVFENGVLVRDMSFDEIRQNAVL